MFGSAWPVALILALLSTAAAAQPAMRLACESDKMKLCPDVNPGRGEIIPCLTSHKEQLSAGCRQALEAGTKPADPWRGTRSTPGEQGQKGSR
jgi:hypothetical protein